LIKILQNKIFLILILLINSTVFLGQNLDSLLSLVNTAKNDSLKIKHIINLANSVLYSNNDTANYYANIGLSICEDYDFNKMKFDLMFIKGQSLSSKSNFTQAQKIFIRAEKLAINNKDTFDICQINNALGSLHKELSELSNYDKIENKQAQKYYLVALDNALLINDSMLIAYCYNNVGITYMIEYEYDKGMTMWQNSLDIKLSLGLQLEAAMTMGNMAMYYRDTKEYKKAYNIYKDIIKIQKDSNSNLGLFKSYDNMGKLFEQKKEYIKSLEYYRLSLNTAKDLNSQHYKSHSFKRLSKNYELLGKFDSAYCYLTKQNILKDSIFSIEQQKNIAEAEEKFDSKKRQYQIELLEKEKETKQILHEAEFKAKEKEEANKRKILYIGIGFLLLLGGLGFWAFFQKKKDNRIIKAKKAEVDLAYENLEDKNNDILASINYAKRIQTALLPTDKAIKESFKESFILYLPKDIVAGDFYWLEKTKDTTLFAVADCTGHGVPGAMVSVICNNGLNRSVREYNITQPSKILDKTREIVIQEFAKSSEDIQDGMDIALCSIKGDKLNYSGAHNPLIIIRNKEVIKVKADRQPIGTYIKPEDFTNHTLDIQKDDMIYIFTDGFVDQFGGEKGKKYRLKNLLILLTDISTKTLSEQNSILKQEFESWKGTEDQIDDVCLMGVRV
jgi:serine phosphatase RsbU (regulator of sigma subunit)